MGLAKHPPFKMILLDTEMTCMPASKFIGAAKKIYKKYPNVMAPVYVAYTQLPRDEVTEFDDYLEKPCLPDQLRHLLSIHKLI